MGTGHGCPRCQFHVIPVQLQYWFYQTVGGDKLTSCLDQSSDRSPPLLTRINKTIFLSQTVLWLDRCEPSQRSQVVLCFINNCSRQEGSGQACYAGDNNIVKLILSSHPRWTRDLVQFYVLESDKIYPARLYRSLNPKTCPWLPGVIQAEKTGDRSEVSSSNNQLVGRKLFPSLPRLLLIKGFLLF